MKRKKYLFIDCIKFIAALLVINSHMDSIYPISALATGGAIGNGLFFFSSGFVSTNVDLPFLKWYIKRISRLIPMTSVMALIRILVLGQFNISTAFIDIIFPTYYWFVAAILIFDIPLYFLVKKEWCIKYKKEIFISLGILYFIYYFTLLDTSKWVVESAGLTSVDGCFKLIYYFAIMLLGAIMHLSIDSEQHGINTVKKANWKLLVISVVSFFAFYGYKILMNHSILFMKLQFIQQFLTSVIVVTFCIFLFSIEVPLKMHINNKLLSVIKSVSGITLELFLAQEFVVIFARQMVFPVSFIVMILGTFTLAYLLNRIDKFIRRERVQRI